MSKVKPTKTCSKCKTEKPVEEFYRDKRAADGLYSQCKTCYTETARRYRQSDKGREGNRRRMKKYNQLPSRKASKHKYRLTHKQGLHEQEKRWRTSELGKQVRRKYRRANAQKHRERRRQYVRRNKERLLAEFREWSRSERGRAYAKNYHKSHRAMYNAQRAVSFAVQLGLLPPVRDETCAGCGRPAVHYHHHLGYEFEHWLDVIPLCYPCHGLTRRKTG